ncbi:hypothetical protein [Gordonia phthalatica]|uniref:Uncharacterized protein n=1 Tax=Gordonia phthalatica TaxID=1136941 RepID=A0A0N9NCA1_9ACTN|nr:hypothetical protein [Gordonia phthalatica]ALG85290.1 hypothetical protein ACH46_13420 [Gordonia phthalatica]
MSSLHIGAAGELLVQYRLLRLGIDSARLTTDSGVDLVAYSSEDNTARTIQVKSTDKPVRAGGKGALALGWSLPVDLHAELLATVLLSTDTVWLFTRDEARELASPRARDTMLLNWYVDPTVRGNLAQHQVEAHRIEHKASVLIG